MVRYPPTGSLRKMTSTVIDDLEIHYLHRPASGAGGQRILYIHGTGCNGRVFEAHLAALAPQHEAVAIDLPGHGRSGGSGFRGVADYAACAAGLVRALGWEPCVVAGHSMGGGIALALALYDPDLVSALIMIDSGARLRVAPAVIRAARAIAAGDKRAVADPRQGFAAATPDTIVAAVRALTAGCDPNVIVKDWIADDTCDFMSRLAAIPVPTLVLCGAEDPLTPPKYHHYLAEHLPQASLAMIDNAGHWPFVEQAPEFDRHVAQFLDALRA